MTKIKKPNHYIPPSEDHVMPRIKKYHCGLGFYGEQGIEAIHQQFNQIKISYASMGPKQAARRISLMMQNHFTKSATEISALKPAKSTKPAAKKTCINTHLTI